MSETWLSNDINNSKLFNVDQYNAFRSENGRRGRRPITAVKASYAADVVCAVGPFYEMDLLVLKTYFHTINILLINVYILPGSPLSMYEDAFHYIE